MNKLQNRFIATAAIATLCVAVVAARASATTYFPGTATYAAVVPLVAARVRSPHYHVWVSNVVVEEPYALASWTIGEGGGQTLLSRSGAQTNGTWTVVANGGGSLADAEGLTQTYHVPRAVAAKLVADIRANDDIYTLVAFANSFARACSSKDLRCTNHLGIVGPYALVGYTNHRHVDGYFLASSRSAKWKVLKSGAGWLNTRDLLTAAPWIGATTAGHLEDLAFPIWPPH